MFITLFTFFIIFSMKKVFIYGNAKVLVNYKNAILKLNALPVISTNIALANDCDCLLLAGGGDVYPEFYGEKDRFCLNKNFSRDFSEFALINLFISKNAPILGICRGLQVLNVYFGGSLNQQILQSNLHFSPNTDCYHKIYLTNNCYFTNIFFKLSIVNSAHRQSVKTLGKGLKTIAVSKDNTIEALCHQKLKITAFQFHPERLKPPFFNLGLELLYSCLQL